MHLRALSPKGSCGYDLPDSGEHEVLQGTGNSSERSQARQALFRSGNPEAAEEAGMAGIRRAGRD